MLNDTDEENARAEPPEVVAELTAYVYLLLVSVGSRSKDAGEGNEHSGARAARFAYRGRHGQIW